MGKSRIQKRQMEYAYSLYYALWLRKLFLVRILMMLASDKAKSPLALATRPAHALFANYSDYNNNDDDDNTKTLRAF